MYFLLLLPKLQKLSLFLESNDLMLIFVVHFFPDEIYAINSNSSEELSFWGRLSFLIITTSELNKLKVMELSQGLEDFGIPWSLLDLNFIYSLRSNEGVECGAFRLLSSTERDE